MRRAARVPSTPLLAASGIVFVIGLAVLVSNDLTDAFDRSIIEALRADLVRDMLSPLRIITELGSTGAVSAMAVVAFVFGMAIGPWRHGLAGAFTILLASVLNSALKITIARERPDLLEPVIVERGFSFPSGHSALGMVAYGVLAVLVSGPGCRRGRARRSSSRSAWWWASSASRASGSASTTRRCAGRLDSGGVIVLVYAALTRRVSPEPAAGRLTRISRATIRPPAAG